MTCKNLKRLTTDNPNGCTEGMLNNIYAKDGRVVIRFTEDGRKDVDLCQYIAEKCKCNYTADDIMKLGCGDCQLCPYGTMYAACIQSAELRERLKMYEDKLENDTLLELPCEVGDTVFILLANSHEQRIIKDTVNSFRIFTANSQQLVRMRTLLYDFSCSTNAIGKTVFLTKAEAEAS
ncbi:MAG: hypothetical protein ACLUFN_07630 [Eubacterium sp.]